MMWRLLATVLLCFAVASVNPTAVQWEQSAHAGPFKRAKAKRSGDSGNGKTLRQRAADKIKNLRPVVKMRRGLQRIKRNADAFRRVKAEQGLGKALGKSIRKLARTAWRKGTPWGRRAARKERVKRAEERLEKAEQAYEAAQAESQAEFHQEQGKLEAMDQLYQELGLSKGGDTRTEALSQEERGRIEEVFGSVDLPAGDLGEKAVSKSGAEQKQLRREKLQRQLRRKIRDQKKRVETAESRQTEPVKEIRDIGRASLRVFAEGLRDGLSVASIDPNEAAQLTMLALDGSSPRSGRMRDAVRDQLTVIDAFANAAEPDTAASLLSHLEEVARDGNGLSGIERTELRRTRGRLTGKTTRLLKEQRENGVDGSDSVFALRMLQSGLGRRDLRMKRKISSALKKHRKVLESRAKAILKASDVEWKYADKRAAATVKAEARALRGRNKLSRAEKKKLRHQVVLQNRAQSLESAAMAKDLVGQLIELHRPIDGEAAEHTTDQDILRNNRKLKKLHSDITRIENRARSAGVDMPMAAEPMDAEPMDAERMDADFDEVAVAE